MSDIFLSYHNSDRPTAQRFADALEAHGWSVWWDREIPLGKHFDQVIEDELNAAGCAIVLWSKESVRSPWVRSEASAAASRERLVPILIEPAPIPLEFRQVQAATLVGWAGDTADPEFVRLLQAIKERLGREPGPASDSRRIERHVVPLPLPWWRSTRAVATALAAAVVLIAAWMLMSGRLTKNDTAESSTSGTTSVEQPSSSSAAASTSPAADPPKSTAAAASPAVAGAMSIKIGDRIEDGVPGPGAGVIETPFNRDTYTFTARAGQRVYFRVVGFTPALSYIKWKVTDPEGTVVFDTCLGCTEAGFHQLVAAGAYTMTVGNDADRSTGAYRLRLYDVPPADQFTVKIDDNIRDGVPGMGAGDIETPGAEDVYSFTAAPRQRVYFRSIEQSTGMGYIKWILTDDDGMEVFNTCLGCTEPGVQTLTRGGTYKLTVGHRTLATTGTYRIRLTNVPPPNEFAIKLGDRIKPGVPGPGAGTIEYSGAEDAYSFTASPGQQVFVRLVDRDKGMDYNKWRLIDDNGMELFNTCLGCSAPAVQPLRGGNYTLIVGNATEPSTGNYAFEIGSR